MQETDYISVRAMNNMLCTADHPNLERAVVSNSVFSQRSTG
jgi:hypothetical protein